LPRGGLSALAECAVSVVRSVLPVMPFSSVKATSGTPSQAVHILERCSV
jgi:hypothetical protein